MVHRAREPGGRSSTPSDSTRHGRTSREALNAAGAIEGYDVIVEQADYINELPRQALWWGPFTDAVTEEIKLAIQNGTSADDVIDTLADEWNALKSEFE